MLWSVEGGRSAVLKKCIRDRNTRLMVVCLIMAFLMLLMIVSLFVIAIYLDLHPRLPIIFITNSTVGKFVVEESGESMLRLQMFMDFNMQSNNRYGIPFRYVNDTLFLEYKGRKVARVETPPFSQEPRSNRSFTATLDPQEWTLEGADAVRGLKYEFQTDRVGVTLAGSIKARFKASKTVSSAVDVPVTCSVVIQPASLTATPKCQMFRS